MPIPQTALLNNHVMSSGAKRSRDISTLFPHTDARKGGVYLVLYIMKHSSFLKSVAVLSVGGFVAKGIGALYRFPLNAMLGGYGMGLYSMAYPLFCVLLTFSSAGIPSAFSRIVARERALGRDASAEFSAALRLFVPLGAVGAVAMCLLAPLLGGLQEQTGLAACYLALAPSVFFVAVIAVLRGYFQGKNDMLPTAESEIVEQLVKAGAGLLFASHFAGDPVRAAAAALFAVSVSEAVALLFLFVRYRAEPRRKLLAARRVSGGSVLAAAFPVMAASSLLPLSQMADSVIIVRLLSRGTKRAVAQYGLFAGGTAGLVSLPATICYGLVAATVTSVSARFARSDGAGGRKRALYALGLTLALSLPCAAALFAFARPIAHFLYPALGKEDVSLLIGLLRVSSVSAATLAGVDTLAACLTGMGKAKRAALSMLIAVAVKHALQFALIPTPLGVAGAAVAANVCYLVAFSLDLFYTVTGKQKEKKHGNDHRARVKRRRSVDARGGGDEGGEERSFEHRVSARRRGIEGGGDRV